MSGAYTLVAYALVGSVEHRSVASHRLDDVENDGYDEVASGEAAPAAEPEGTVRREHEGLLVCLWMCLLLCNHH